jgi:MFS family permease
MLFKIEYKWLILLLSTLMQALSTTVVFGFGILAICIQQELNLTLDNIATIVFLVNFGPILSLIFIGKRIDKYGEKVMLLIGMFITAFLLLILSTLRLNFSVILFFALTIGIFYAVSIPAGSIVVLKFFKKEQRGLAFGIRQTGIPIGYGIGSGLLPILIKKIGAHNCIFVESLACFIAGAIFFVFYRSPQNLIQKNLQSNLGLLTVIKDTKFLSIALIGPIMLCTQFAILIFYIPYLKTIGFTVVEAGFLLSIFNFAGCFGRIFLAWFNDKFMHGNRLLMLVFCMIIGGFSLISIPYLKNTGAILFFAIIFGLFAIGWYSLFIAAISEYYESEASFLTSIALTFNQI